VAEIALDLATLKTHCNVTIAVDDALLSRLLDAAKAKVEGDLGYALADTTQLPTGAPSDLEQAVLMTAAHWYENREATLVGVIAQTLPHGAEAIIANHRKYTFG
jgi:hypothetical protein